MAAVLLRARTEWRRSFWSLLALTLLVAVASAVVMTALAGARRTRSSVAAFDRANHSADFYIDLETNSTRGAAEIAALPEVEKSTLWGVPTALPITDDDAYAPLLAPIADTQRARLESGFLLAGRRPHDDAIFEIALPQAQATVLKARVGDEIPFARFSRADARRCLFAEHASPGCDTISHTPAFKMRVVGIVRTGTDLVHRTHDVSLAFASPAFYEHFRDDVLWSPELIVALRPGADADEFEAAARGVLPPGTQAVFNRPNRSSITDAVDVLAVGLAIFGAIAGLAGALAIGQAVRRQALRPAADDAVLRAIGATRRSRAAGLIMIFVPVAIAGLVLAVLASWVASRWMPISIARRITPAHGFDFDVLVVGAVAVIALVLIFGIAGFASVRARRPRAERSGRVGFGARLSSSIADPRAAVGLRYATVRGQGADAVPVRSAFLASVVAVAGVIGVLGFAAGLHYLVETPSMYGWHWNVLIANDHRDRVLADPDVGAVADLATQVPVRVQGASTLLMSMKPVRGAMSPAIIAGRAPQTRDEIALGAKTMSNARVGIGDAVRVQGTDGELMMRVVGQGVFPTTGDGYPLADGGYVAPSALADLGTGDNVANLLAVAYRPGADQAAVYARLAKLEATGQRPDQPAPPSELDNLQRVESLPLVLAGFLALLGLTALVHALTVSVRRRAVDLATLRCVGFRPRDVAIAVAYQGALIGGVGALIGIPIGVLLGRVSWQAVADRTGVLVVQRLPVPALLIVVPVAVIVAVMAAVIPARRAARLRTAEVLRGE